MSEITIAEADSRRAREQVLDVREDAEVAGGMIPGALHIPMDQLGGRLAACRPAHPLNRLGDQLNRTS